MGIEVLENIDLVPVLVELAAVGDPSPKRDQFHPLVPRWVGHHQLAARVPKTPQQMDGVLGALAGNHPGRLQNQQVAAAEPHRLLDIGGIVVARIGRVLIVQHIGDEQAGDPLAPPELILSRLIDDHMVQARDPRREGHHQVVLHRRDLKPPTLPVEIVMIGDGGHPGLEQKLRHRHPERDVHGDGKHILQDQDVQIEAFPIGVKGALEILGQLADPLAGLLAASRAVSELLVDPEILRVAEEGLGNAQTRRWVPVQHPPVPVAHVPVLPEHLRPLSRLQGNAVGARELGRNKTGSVIILLFLISHLISLSGL